MADGPDTSFTFLSTPGLILVYPHLLEARAFTDPKTKKPKGAPKFSAGFVLDPQSTDWEAFKAHCVTVAREKWPGIDLKTGINPKDGWPWRSGTVLADAKKAKDESDPSAFMRGKILIRASTGADYPPRLCGFEPNKKEPVNYEVDNPVQRAAVKGKFKPGMLVLAKVNVKAVEMPNGTKYVTTYLSMVCSTGKVGAVIATRSAASVFSGYQGHITQEDPTGGQTFDDEIPL